MSAPQRKIAVVGAGPIGLEAALYAALQGFNVQVYERGEAAHNVRDWGHVRLFSPFGLNSSPWGREALQASGNGVNLAAADELLTGRDYVERYLVPLSRLPALSGRVHEHVEVCAVGRSRTWKRDLIGDPKRGEDPFRLLLRDASGERTVEADIVLDCSGTYPHHNWVGAGGIPCPGERDALQPAQYRLPDILGAERSRFAGTRTLVVGSGYSAATAVVSLAELAASNPGTSAVWITRSHRSPPVAPIENDPLPERRRLCEEANRLARGNGGLVHWRPGCVIGRIAIDGDGRDSRYIVVAERIGGGGGGAFSAEAEEIMVDRVIANVGYRPDRRLYEELQVHECYASQGPMKLAAALLGETSADCLNQGPHGAETLVNPEPGLFILGAKSYGRDSRFLIKLGLEQIGEVFSLIDRR